MSKKPFPSSFIEVILFSSIIVALSASVFIIKILFPELPKEIMFTTSYISYFIFFVISYYTVNKLNKVKVSFNFRLYKNILFLMSIVGLYQISVRIPIYFLFNTSEIVKESLSFSFIISAILLAPIIEEIIFRGVILKGFLFKYSPKIAIVLSALMFALMHFTSLISIISALILGLFIGYVYYKTKSVGMTILLHTINNITGVLGLFLNNKFGNSNSQIVSIIDIYGNYSIYIIGVPLVVFVFLLFKLIKKNKEIFKTNEQKIIIKNH